MTVQATALSTLRRCDYPSARMNIESYHETGRLVALIQKGMTLEIEKGDEEALHMCNWCTSQNLENSSTGLRFLGGRAELVARDRAAVSRREGCKTGWERILKPKGYQTA